MQDRRVILPGSERAKVATAQSLGPVDPSEQFEVTVYLRGKEDPLPHPYPGHFVTNEEYAAIYGATAEDFQKVSQFAASENLEVVKDASGKSSENVATRSVRLKGTAADLSRAFGTSLETAVHKGVTFRHRSGALTVPVGLDGVVTAVVGLDNRPQAKPHSRIVNLNAVSAAALAQSLTPLAVGQLYNFPAGLDGSGQIIAILEFGGGYRQSDLDAYFQGLGLKTPTVKAVSVDGAKNNPKPAPKNPNDPDPDGEVALDIEVAGALAPGAAQLVYFAPNSDQGFLDALNMAITATPAPAVVSLSWGSAESNWSEQGRQQFETALQHAAQLGIPVTVAAGDDGSFDNTSSPVADFPSAAPHALGCGGTTLIGSGSSISSETVWSVSYTDSKGQPGYQGTGGGVSQFYPKPSYQASVSVPAPPGGGTGGGRGVPDVAGDADPATGYTMRLRGQNTVSGGTSAVAPLWAALIARFKQKIGQPVGFLNTFLYESSTRSAFRDITQGNNDTQNQGGPYSAGPGWDACTGLGSPNGTALLTALQAAIGHTGTGSTGHKGTGTTGHTGSTGKPAHFDFPVMPPVTPLPVPAPLPAPTAPTLTSTLLGGDNSVAIVGVVGLAAVVGMVATAGIVATVALAKDK